jgi:hypothetical protein
LSLFLIGQTPVFACSCAARPTVLDYFESSKLVVAAKVVSVEKVKNGENNYAVDGVKSTKMVVEKVYKGNVKVGDELTFAQGGGADCIWTFSEDNIGEHFLFYLNSPTTGHPFFGEQAQKYEQPMYTAVTCGRSNVLEYATDDLLYLDNLDKARGRTRISGTLGSWSENSPNFANVKVKIIGKNKTYETVTDKNGVYEIYDLPAGEYLIEADVPKGWKLNDYTLNRYASDSPRIYALKRRAAKNQAPVVLKAKRHAAMDLLFEIDNAVRGKVGSVFSKPSAESCVNAVSTKSGKGDHE